MDFSGSYVKAGIGGSVFILIIQLAEFIVLAFVCGFIKQSLYHLSPEPEKIPSIGRHENQLRPAPAAWIPTGIRFEDQEERGGWEAEVSPFGGIYIP